MQEDRIASRFGLNVPAEWWPAPPLVKEIEAAGFGSAQVHSPPPSVLEDPRSCARHAAALHDSFATTDLVPVVHGPAALRLGAEGGDLAFEGLLSYAAEIGASHVVYHAACFPDALASQDRLLAETRSLASLAERAERLEVTIAIENLAPVYPAPEVLSCTPMVLRSLVKRIGSERVGVCLDIGHANVVAGLRHASITELVAPVLDRVALFHIHDNLGARHGGDGPAGLDPLRLDLHLPPGRGTVPWDLVARLLDRADAPLMLEVHPPHRSSAAGLYEDALEALAPAAVPALAA